LVTVDGFVDAYACSGSSSTEACQLLEATLQLEREAHTISERSLKCVKLSQVGLNFTNK